MNTRILGMSSYVSQWWQIVESSRSAQASRHITGDSRSTLASERVRSSFAKGVS